MAGSSQVMLGELDSLPVGSVFMVSASHTKLVVQLVVPRPLPEEEACRADGYESFKVVLDRLVIFRQEEEYVNKAVQQLGVTARQQQGWEKHDDT